MKENIKNKIYNIEISDKTLNYILTGLEFYCIYINNCYYLSDEYDFDEKSIQYADVFYTYHYFLCLSDNRRRIRLEKPPKFASKKILDFFNNKEIS